MTACFSPFTLLLCSHNGSHIFLLPENQRLGYVLAKEEQKKHIKEDASIMT